ncbi:hypothetical protein GGS20DRAFT_282351 [Poronia punctata]|nr:hypothetical protein GGS20DRAFT_282351 [Poronia punctata]
MKTRTIAIVGAAQVVAKAAAPSKSFNVPALELGWANACRGADTLVVTTSPEALTWRFTDIAASYPATDSAPSSSICVMMNDLGDMPGGWRFAVDNVQTSGKGKLTGGAVVTSLWTKLDMEVSYMKNPLENAEHVWAKKSRSMGSFNLVDTTFVGSRQELDGDFDVKVKANGNGTNWSPCWPEFVYPNQYRIQFNHQTHVDLGETPDASDPQGTIDGNLQVALNLKWEACNSTANGVENWGEGGDMPAGWMPYKYRETPKY